MKGNAVACPTRTGGENRALEDAPGQNAAVDATTVVRREYAFTLSDSRSMQEEAADVRCSLSGYRLNSEDERMEQANVVAITAINEAEALQAAREFAAVLAETPEYEAFDRAQARLWRDAAAQEAIRAFQQRQQSLRTMMMLGAVSDADRNDLQHLQREMLAQPTVQAYVEAQEQLSSLCQQAAKVISDVIGLRFAASCGPGCC